MLQDHPRPAPRRAVCESVSACVQEEAMKLFCVHCLKPFESAAPNRQYCTPVCQKAYAKAERDYKRTRQANYRFSGQPSNGGHVFDLGLQEERYK